MSARDQPLSLVVSTAGDNLAGPCRQDWLDCQHMLEGTVPDEALFALIYTIDDDTDWTSEAALRMANPNFGVSINAANLLDDQAVAIKNARKQNHFKTKHLNIWVQSRNAYFNMESWRQSKSTATLESMGQRRCFMALDLASRNDLAVIELLFEPVAGKFQRFGIYYLPRATVDKPENEHYQLWEKLGYLRVCEGNIIEYRDILEDIKQICRGYNVVDLAYDPYNATMLVTELMSEGLPCTEFGATVKNFSEPMKEVDARVLDKCILHDGDPVAEYCMSNVQAKIDAKDGVFPRKERYIDKIDQAVALIMAMGRYLVGAEAEDDWSGFIKKPVIV